jgi:hypothetical protein
VYNKNIVLVMILFISTIANGADKIVLPKILSSSQIILGSSVESALKKKNKNFKLFNRTQFSKIAIDSGKETPMAVAADFNSDGLRDIALLGFSKAEKKIYIYVAVSNKANGTYDIYELNSFDLESKYLKHNPMYLTIAEFKNEKLNQAPILQVETNGPGDVSVVPYYFSNKQNDFDLFNGKFD